MIYISLGSNIGCRIVHLQRAVELMKERCLSDLKGSIVLETKSILPDGAPPEWDKPYLNMVVAGNTTCSPDELLRELKQIESDIGRPEVYARWSPRVIDLDILLWDGVTHDAPHLKIPHAELKNRFFFIHLIRLLGGTCDLGGGAPERFLSSLVLSPRFVGIVNVTDNSFSDGGEFRATEAAVTQALKLCSDGASVIDIGTQSTRPGAAMIGAQEEYARLEPVLDGLAPSIKNREIFVSLDTFHPDVVQKALQKYPLSWINDVKGDLDDATLRLIAEKGCCLCTMHSLGIPPSKSNVLPTTLSPLTSLQEWAKRKIDHLRSLGFTEKTIILDPGIGFGKNPYQNIEIIRHIDRLKGLHVPLLVGHSRKSFMESFSARAPKDRDIETIAVSCALAPHVDFLRVHNVADHMRFLTAQAVVAPLTPTETPMDDFVSRLGQAFLMAAGMFWSVGWGLVIGFLISAALQVFVSKEKMSALLGGDGVKQIALATGFGAASASCSYASTAITRTLIQKGAGFISSLAFLFSSTNLVIELGIILYLLMGWQFMAAEWIGGIVLVAIMSLIVRFTYPKRLVEEARRKAQESSIGQESQESSTKGFLEKLRDRKTYNAIARNFVMDWAMLWKDLVAGFLIGGVLSVFVPNGVWQALFVTNLPPMLQVPLNAMIAPLIASISFLCSDANVPMAAVLWGSGISFGGVLSFLYADLIVLPLLDVYRRYFGWKMAVYIGVVFYVTMVLTGIIMDSAFKALGFVPEVRLNIHAEVTHFSINYTFWLNLIFGVIGLALVWLAAKGPKPKSSCCCH